MSPAISSPLCFQFNRENRLKNPKFFKFLFKNGYKINGYYYAVYFFYTQEATSLGISIPKRFGNAVYRNRQKRIIREVFRKNLPEFQGLWKILVVQIKNIDKPFWNKIELENLFIWIRGLSCGSEISG